MIYAVILQASPPRRCRAGVACGPRFVQAVPWRSTVPGVAPVALPVFERHITIYERPAVAGMPSLRAAIRPAGKSNAFSCGFSSRFS